MFGDGSDLDTEDIHCGKFVRKLCHDANVGKTGLRRDLLFIGTKVMFPLLYAYAIRWRILFTGFMGGIVSDLFVLLKEIWKGFLMLFTSQLIWMFLLLTR